MKVTSYENLIVWQKAMDLVAYTYEATAGFPSEERFGLISQMRRASVSIPSNIAEGSRRGTRKDFRSFLLNAYGSGAELETQVKLATRLGFIENIEAAKMESALDEVMRMLNSFIKKMC